LRVKGLIYQILLKKKLDDKDKYRFAIN